ncbi:hypothetical protein FRC04_011225 [Tulasnella sp. 424]|nr:hypothetical protein FRC04_011225 [Tulasnella sp. 424]
MAPSRDTTAQARPSLHFQTHDDADMAHALQRQVSQGSPSACLSLGDVIFAAAIQRNRSSSSSRSSLPRARSRSVDDTIPYSLFTRAASLYITGLVWAFSLSSPALARRHSPNPTTASSSASPGKTSTTGSAGSPIQPPPRDYALICNLVRNLTFVIQKAPFHRRRHHLNDAALVLPEMQAGIHQAVLHDTLGVLGWTATPATDDDPSGIVTIPTIAYRLSKQFLPALLHAEDELTATASATSSGVVRGEDKGALISLLGDLSSAAAMAHNARGHSSSSSLAEPDSAAEESNSNSSYPTSPETRLLRLDISHDQDNDESNEEILNDSPPTTPSQTSSSDDLSKPLYTTAPSHPTHPHHHHVAFRNILQERLGGIDTKSHTTNSVGFPRSNTIDTISSGVSSPISHRSRSSSIRSTASSIFERMCGQPKSKTTISLHAEPQSTMGSFTPVSAKTASTSLRRFGVPTTTNGRVWGARMKSRLGMPTEFWDSDDAGVESDSAAPSPSKPIVRRHARSATTSDVPAISMTHASFIPESMLDVRPKAPPHSRATAPTRSQTQPQPQTRVSPPRSRTPSKASPPIPSIASVLAPQRAQVPPRRSQTDPISGPTRGLPKLDPTLAALEKGCRLKAKVSCAHCGKVGWDFPKNRQGDALCTRECRVAFKAVSEGKGKGREGAVAVRVGA